MATKLFGTIAVIGLGLIGSSFLHAVRRGGLADQTIGIDVDEDVRETAAEINLADEIVPTGSSVLAKADLIVLAVPIGAMKLAVSTHTDHLKPNVIVTDVGSAKVSVIEEVAEVLPRGMIFVPGHPLAGTEHSGPEAGFAELFDDRWCILTPSPDTDQHAVDQVMTLWKEVGCHVELMTAEDHDIMIAIMSDLPHWIATNLVTSIKGYEEKTKKSIIKYSDARFRDTTRIAASRPEILRDVFLNNKYSIIDAIESFSDELENTTRAIRNSSSEDLYEIFERARDVRTGMVVTPSMGEPEFDRVISDRDSAKSTVDLSTLRASTNSLAVIMRLIDDEIDRLNGTIPNDPTSRADHDEKIELLAKIKDSMGMVVDAVVKQKSTGTEVGDLRSEIRRALEIVAKSVSEHTQVASDLLVKVPLAAAGISALVTAGAATQIATPVILVAVFGQSIFTSIKDAITKA